MWICKFDDPHRIYKLFIVLLHHIFQNNFQLLFPLYLIKNKNKTKPRIFITWRHLAQRAHYLIQNVIWSKCSEKKIWSYALLAKLWMTWQKVIAQSRNGKMINRRKLVWFPPSSICCLYQWIGNFSPECFALAHTPEKPTTTSEGWNRMGSLGRAIYTVGVWFRESGQAIDRLGCRLQGKYYFQEQGTFPIFMSPSFTSKF